MSLVSKFLQHWSTPVFCYPAQERKISGVTHHAQTQSGLHHCSFPGCISVPNRYSRTQKAPQKHRRTSPSTECTAGTSSHGLREKRFWAIAMQRDSSNPATRTVLRVNKGKGKSVFCITEIQEDNKIFFSQYVRP